MIWVGEISVVTAALTIRLPILIVSRREACGLPTPIRRRQFVPQHAAALSPAKYVRTGTQRQLFDLSVDQREKSDFSLKNPDVLERLAAEFDNWNRQMLPRINR